MWDAEATFDEENQLPPVEEEAGVGTVPCGCSLLDARVRRCQHSTKARPSTRTPPAVPPAAAAMGNFEELEDCGFAGGGGDCGGSGGDCGQATERSKRAMTLPGEAPDGAAISPGDGHLRIVTYEHTGCGNAPGAVLTSPLPPVCVGQCTHACVLALVQAGACIHACSLTRSDS